MGPLAPAEMLPLRLSDLLLPLLLDLYIVIVIVDGTRTLNKNSLAVKKCT